VRRIVEWYPKTRKMLFLDLAPPTLQNFGIVHDSTRSIQYKGCVLWNKLPSELQESMSVNRFKPLLKLHFAKLY